MLLDLPVELLEAIARQVAGRSDLKHLCEASSRLYQIAVPFLYESITLNAQDEESLDDIDVSSLMRTRYTPRNLLRYVKNIEIASPFHYRTRSRCIHHYPRYDSDSDDSKPAEEEFDSMSRQTAILMPLLEGCRENQIESFTWDLGSCIPQEILGQSGYLQLKQKRIRSLRLVTEGVCAYNLNIQSPINLSTFTDLEEISWKGLRLENEVESLGDVLSQVSDQLVTLELDFFDWSRLILELQMDSNEEAASFVWQILSPPPKSTNHIFPVLQVLSLSHISLKTTAIDMPHTFDLSLLRSLRLRFCHGWEDFLENSSRLSKPTRLRVFKIQSNSSLEINPEDSLSRFLRSFHGLVELAICTGSPARTLDIWRAVVHHNSTLRAFVHHQRGNHMDDDSPFAEEECDKLDLSLSTYDEQSPGWAIDPSQNPLSELRVDFLGLCCEPKLLERILSPLAGKRSLRLLHIRQSGDDLYMLENWGLLEDVGVDTATTSQSGENGAESECSPKKLTARLHNLAQWAFGPQGLPSLEAIICGDFSYDGRYHQSNVFLSRNYGHQQHDCAGQTFRQLSQDDQQRRELLGEYKDMISACPATPLLLD
ncbi:hypothetical protein IQ07DRAFT_631268 [Pyrenochaeta sp. DS3sAY3a]|nr:hypothetical protein IQ07DRAFT_631268 [Pyrenochaeta sp. DS3sAY3a]